MNYSFRRMTHDDLEGVWTIIEHLKLEGAEVTFTELLAREEAMQWIDNPAHLTYVAIDDDHPGSVLAMIRGRRELSPEKAHAAFLTAATLPSARGTGLAAELTQFALTEMQREGVNIVRIYVYSDNALLPISRTKVRFYSRRNGSPPSQKCEDKRLRGRFDFSQALGGSASGNKISLRFLQGQHGQKATIPYAFMVVNHVRCLKYWTVKCGMTAFYTHQLVPSAECVTYGPCPCSTPSACQQQSAF